MDMFKSLTLKQVIPWILLIGGALGLFAATMLTIDKIELLKNPDALFVCDLNPIFSCGSVMDSEQAEAFGFSNTIIGVFGFSTVATIGAGILAGAKYKKWFWQGLQLGTIFGIGFVHWLIYQSIYDIRALCLYCMVVWTVMIPIFLYTTIYNLQEKNIKLGKNHKKIVALLSDHHPKILLTWYLLIIGLIIYKFWYFWSTLI